MRPSGHDALHTAVPLDARPVMQLSLDPPDSVFLPIFVVDHECTLLSPGQQRPNRASPVTTHNLERPTPTDPTAALRPARLPATRPAAATAPWLAL